MSITSEDITYTLSGGNNNIDPLDSLGGERSFYSAIGTTIFPDIKQETIVNGRIDYRCVYVNNYNGNSTLFETKVYLASQTAGGAVLSMGFDFLNERQDLKITKYDTITSGNFNINYQYLFNDNLIVASTFQIDYNSDFTVMANQIKDSLRSVLNLEDVSVSVYNDTSIKEVSFQIEFFGSAGNRYHDLITLTNVNFFGLSGTITITRTVAGGPINRIADQTDNDILSPVNVVFANYTNASPALIGDLRPLDFFPVWIKRTCPAGVASMELDGGIIRLLGGIV
jgi:hypothetical protein